MKFKLHEPQLRAIWRIIQSGNTYLVSTLLALKHAQTFAERNLLDDRINLKIAWKLAQYAS
ncbi:MAG TPA: hypothetical protein VLH56_13940 [Dissulfurispiraceae bacterium]|nr:hypothetical protein [Dissulfurispiraceae bacterium]